MSRPTALGRGLGALIPGVAPAAPLEPEPLDAGPLSIPIDAIDPNPDQPRRVFDPEQIHSLADSIRRHGVLHQAFHRAYPRVARDENQGMR